MLSPYNLLVYDNDSMKMAGHSHIPLIVLIDVGDDFSNVSSLHLRIILEIEFGSLDAIS